MCSIFVRFQISYLAVKKYFISYFEKLLLHVVVLTQTKCLNIRNMVPLNTIFAMYNHSFANLVIARKYIFGPDKKHLHVESFIIFFEFSKLKPVTQSHTFVALCYFILCPYFVIA